MLRVEDLCVSYGGLAALRDVSIKVGRGQLVAVIGSNGAGKSTLFKAISGVAPTQSGRLFLDDVDVGAELPSARAERGLAHVPEGRQVFKTMTVEENLELGAFRRAARARYPENLAMIYALFPQLKEGRKRLAGTLSGGQQQMLAIGRGLAADPQLLMLDEPSMGLAPRVVDQIFDSIFRLHHERRFTVLLVEQRAAEALEGCDYGYVLESGRVILAGEGAALMAHPSVRKAYLGTE
jgi:branched-chain amino acid transport system ATP-binding protein